MKQDRKIKLLTVSDESADRLVGQKHFSVTDFKLKFINNTLTLE